MTSKKISKPTLRIPLATLSASTMNSEITVGSPMSNLAHNLSELSTGRGTPKRKLSLSSVDTPTDSTRPTPERVSSTESGCFVDSPTLIDSPTLEMSLHRFSSVFKRNVDIPPDAFSKKKTIAFRKIDSSPLPMLRYDSPTDFQDKENSFACDKHDDDVDLFSENHILDLDESSSQDSGIDIDKDKDERFRFAVPAKVPPRRSKIISEDTCSPQKYSPVKSPSKKRSFSETFSPSNEDGPLPTVGSTSPVNLKMSPLTSSEGDVDDGFLEIFDQEVATINDQVPGSMAKLFSAPVLNKLPKFTDDDDTTPVTRRSIARRFIRSQSFDVRTQLSFKRSDPPQDEMAPIQNKRRKPGTDNDNDGDDYAEVDMKAVASSRSLHRCHSANEALMMSACARLSEEPDLIGDCSKPYCLPTVPSKHQDLKGITPDTLYALMTDQYNDVIYDHCIVDCRYPYEYTGGHVQGAKNLYTKDLIIKEFIQKPWAKDKNGKQLVLIFHCEFSSERGPNLSRFLRNRDREMNKDCYPGLLYPEIYLLEGGYKAFFEKYQHMCEPQGYKPMLHKDHSNDLRHFRAKSKLWAGEKTAGRPGLRNLKF